MDKVQHIKSLRSLIDSEFVPTDDWKAIEYDGLDDLGFTLTGIYSMTLEHEDEYGEEKKTVFVEVTKKRGGKWIVKLSKEREGTREVVREFNTYKAMLDFIHLVFQKI